MPSASSRDLTPYPVRSKGFYCRSLKNRLRAPEFVNSTLLRTPGTVTGRLVAGVQLLEGSEVVISSRKPAGIAGQFKATTSLPLDSTLRSGGLKPSAESARSKLTSVLAVLF